MAKPSLIELWIVRLGRHKTKERQQKRRSWNDSNGSLHAFFAGTGNDLATENQEKMQAYFSAFSSKI